MADYGRVENAILIAAPLVQAAVVTGATAGAIVEMFGRVVLGLLVGLGAGLVVSVFLLAVIYASIGAALLYAAKGMVVQPGMPYGE